jgi:alanyl-tRNA synthetase
MIAFSTDEAIGKDVRADALVKAVAEGTGGSGGGKAHYAQGKLGDPAKAESTFDSLFSHST